MNWIDLVVQDVAELDYNSPEGQPDVMLARRPDGMQVRRASSGASARPSSARWTCAKTGEPWSTAEFRALDMREDWRAVEHGFDDSKTPNGPVEPDPTARKEA